eukprot:EG_transcript_6799
MVKANDAVAKAAKQAKAAAPAATTPAAGDAAASKPPRKTKEEVKAYRKERAKRRAVERKKQKRAEWKAQPLKEKKKKWIQETRLVLSKLPLDVRQSDLKAALPGLSAFKRYRSVSGRWLPTAFIRFTTAKQTKAALALGTVTVKGHTVTIEPCRTGQEKEERMKRTAFFKFYAPDLKEEEVRAAFPTAASVTVAPCAQEDKVKCFVLFPTAAEFETALAQQAGVLRGQPVHLHKANSYQMVEAQWELEHDKCVRLAPLPADVAEADLWAKFPTARRVFLRLPNAADPQHSAGVVMRSRQEAKDLAQVGSVELKGHSVPVELHDTLSKTRQRTLFLANCPPDTTVAALQAQFPQAADVQLLPSPEEFSGDAVVVFAASVEARRAAECGHFELDGTLVHVRRGGTEAQEARRSALLHGCPATTTAEHVRQRFPNAVYVQRHSAPNAADTSAFVVEFATPEDANLAARARHVQINGGFAEIAPKEDQKLRGRGAKKVQAHQERVKAFAKKFAQKMRAKGKKPEQKDRMQE